MAGPGVCGEQATRATDGLGWEAHEGRLCGLPAGGSGQLLRPQFLLLSHWAMALLPRAPSSIRSHLPRV